MTQRDPYDLQGNEQRQQVRQQDAHMARKIEVEDVKWLMSSRQGRRLMARLLAMTGVETTTFTGSSETFHREGKRSIGVAWLTEVKTQCPLNYITMLQEQLDGRRNPDDDGSS